MKYEAETDFVLLTEEFNKKFLMCQHLQKEIVSDDEAVRAYKYWKLYTYFVSKWVNREYRQLFTKNQFHQAMKHAKVNNLSTVTYEQVLSIFNSYLLFNGRK